MSRTAKMIAPPPAPLHVSEQDFAKGVRWSIIAHLVLAVFVIVKSLVFPSRSVLYVPALRVDIVGLPDVLKGERYKLAQLPPAQDSKTLDALKKAENEAKNVKAPKKSQPVEQAEPDEMVLKPKTGHDEAVRQKRMSNALNRIKALAKISGDPENKATAGQVIKGNRISRGTSLSGEARESAMTGYYDLLQTRLQENWALPVWIARQQLSAQVSIQIDGRGRLQNFRFIRLSGNRQFDDAVKKTLLLSQPYPPPPAELSQGLLTSGIVVGFPL